MPPKAVLTLTPALSPAKIVLLGLVVSYCAGHIPQTTNTTLLDEIIRLIDGASPRPEDQRSLETILPTLENVLSALEKANGEGFPTIERYLLQTLWGFNSVDALGSFVARAKALLVEGPPKGLSRGIQPHPTGTHLLTATSFFGAFVIGIVQSFEVVDFDDATKLFEAFRRYREASRPRWKALSGPLACTDALDEDPLFEKVMRSNRRLLGNETGDIIMVARDDVAKLIDRQIYLLEAYGAPTPSALKRVLGLMTQVDNAAMPTSHYVKYLEFLRENDYEGAFESLHRYFDYMMSHSSKNFYHYALLSQATLHAHFNCDAEALRSVEEAISVARENKDLNCLNYLLAWLFNFLKDRPWLLRTQSFYATKDQLLQFLKAKAKQTSPSLYAMTYQFEALRIMVDGGPLTTLLEALTKASFLALNDTLTTFVRNAELQATVWNRIGLSGVAERCVDIALRACVLRKNVAAEVSVAIRKAYLLHARGEIDEAFATLNRHREVVLRDGALFRLWEARRLVLLVVSSIRKGRYKIAETYLDRLRAQGVADVDLQNETEYLLAQLWVCVGRHADALELVLGLTTQSQYDHQRYNVYWCVRFNLLAASIFTQTAVPTRGLSLTLQNLTRAKTAGAMPLLMEGAVVLAAILIETNQHADALLILESVMPQVLLLNILELKARAYLLLARAAFGLFSPGEEGGLDSWTSSLPETAPITQKKRVNVILDHLAVAINGYKQLNGFREMIQCFQVEAALATVINEPALGQHASEAMVKLEQRMGEEARYGLIE